MWGPSEARPLDDDGGNAAPRYGGAAVVSLVSGRQQLLLGLLAGRWWAA